MAYGLYSMLSPKAQVGFLPLIYAVVAGMSMVSLEATLPAAVTSLHPGPRNRGFTYALRLDDDSDHAGLGDLVAVALGEGLELFGVHGL